jgi:predicted regulator of Ras-like GTPase activity (Roadblock/LC7/MglB family)/FixJ family two-component response regulator
LKTCEPTSEETEEPKSEKTKILMVDSDIELLEKLWSFLNEDHNVIKTKSTEEAFTILELQGKDWSDILLVDIDSFGEESLELIIDAKKENPNLQIIGITSTKTPSIRETLLLDSPMIFLEKPITDDRLTDALSQAINIQCTISETEEQYLELIDLIHLLTIVKSTACLDIEKTPSETGEIYIENGKITRANYQEQSDIDAFKTIINWENGSFSIKLGETPEKKALDSFWWELVSETPEAETEAEIIDKETLRIIQEKLTKLKREIAEIKSFGIITIDGKLLYSIFEDESICKEICPIMTEIVSTSEELCDLQNKGEWSEISIIGEKGDIHIWPITDKFILLLTTAFDTNWAMLNMYCQEVSEEIAILLKS